MSPVAKPEAFSSEGSPAYDTLWEEWGGSLESHEVEKELAREEEMVGYAERQAARSRKITPGVSQEDLNF